MTASQPLGVLLILGRDIKLAHSVFALPFAALAACMAARGLPTVSAALLILGCMFFARTYAMLMNRYLDRDVDARNPRTAQRAIPAGKVQPQTALITAIICAVAFVGCAGGFYLKEGNFWPLVLSPIALLVLGVYPLFKRFSWLSHLVLGLALAISPIGAALAIDPSTLQQVNIWMLGIFVLFWVAGFDVIYALQDIEVDHSEQLHSIPAKLGRNGALIAAKVMHVGALLALVVVQRTTMAFRGPAIEGTTLSWFTLATVVVAVLLLIEHRAATRDRFTMAFFTANGLISILIAIAGIADLLK